MLLLDSFSFSNRKANIYQLREDFYMLEFYMDNALKNKFTLVNLVEAKQMADAYVDGRQMLNENA